MPHHRAQKVMRYRWGIFAILALAYFFVYFHRLSLSVVANNIAQEFSASASVLGLLGSLYFYCYAIMQLPAGLLSDSIGPRRTVTFFLIIASAGSFIFGIAPRIEIAFAGRILVGFGVSMVFIPTMKILSQWFRTREFALMAGILNAVGGLGVMAATWLLALLTNELGWRLSFEFIGGFTLIIAVGVWLIVRDKPTDMQWPTIYEIDSIQQPEGRSTDNIGLLDGARIVITNKYFWPVAIWFFFDCGVFFGFGALWSGPYLTHVYGMSGPESGAILSMIAWGMIIGSPLLGFLSDKVLKSRKKLFILCGSALSIVFLLLYIYPASLPKGVLASLFFFISVCSSAIVVLGFTTTKELFPLSIAGTSVGTVNLFPFLGGAVYMPLLGRVLDTYPKLESGVYSLQAYSMMLLLLLISSLMALGCTFFMKETFHYQ